MNDSKQNIGELIETLLDELRKACDGECPCGALDSIIFNAVADQARDQQHLCWYCEKARSRLVPVFDVGMKKVKFYCFPCLLSHMEEYRREDRLDSPPH